MQNPLTQFINIIALVLAILYPLNAIAGSAIDKTDSFIPNQGSPYYLHLFAAGESVSNLAGGLHSGTAYDGITYAQFAMNGPVIGLPNGGRFRARALAIAGGQPSSKLIGDFQVASNIEATPNILLYDIWYRQDFNSLPLQLRFGIIDLNEFFDVTNSASNLLNSSFGVDAALSGNAALSIYPKPGVGVMARYRLASNKFLLGLFSGNPADRSDPFRSGRFSIGEWQHTVSPAIHFKLGAWACDCSTAPANQPKTGTYGLYGSMEYHFGDNTTNPDSLFLRLASSHGTDTIVPKSIGMGVNYPGLFTTRPNDVFSAGITQAQFNNHEAETSYELTYLWQVNANVVIQPDFQYIHHPNGNLPDARVLIFRVTLSYDTHFSRVKR